jgi:hypothetical protein
VDGCEQGDFAVIVIVDTHPKIDLVGACIGVELFIKPQDGVTRGEFYGLKEGAHLRCQ